MEKIELKVINITNSQTQASAYALVLQEVGGNRQLPIIIGAPEAQSIAIQIKEIHAPRPLTHDLFTSCLVAFEISLVEVLIYKAKEGVFYSYVYFQKDDKTLRIDSRTSDAIALAVRFYCPIYIYESILKEESINLEEKETIEEEIEDPDDLTDFEDIQRTNAAIEHAANIGRQNLDSLRKALEKAIEEENYELASILRDEIARRSR